MTRWNGWSKFQAVMRAELFHLTTINPSDRRWQMPFAAALASGLPLLVGAYFDRMDYGLISSLGGLVFLYLPDTPLYHRMVSLMACAFAMSACYALGVMSHFFPPLMVPVLVFTAILVTMVCRFYRLGPPGSLFFIMAASIGVYTPGEVLQVPLKVGLLTMGCLLSCLIAFFYSVYILRLQSPEPVTPLSPPTFDFVVFDSVVIGVFVGVSLALAQTLQLEKAYWVPVSCLAVIQGMSLRGMEQASAPCGRHRHRSAGGLGPADATAGQMEHILGHDSVNLRDRDRSGAALRVRHDLHHAVDDPAGGGCHAWTRIRGDTASGAVYRYCSGLRRRPYRRRLSAQPALSSCSGPTDAAPGPLPSRVMRASALTQGCRPITRSSSCRDDHQEDWPGPPPPCTFLATD
jgi:hypothetical protein